jgi:hypothetical protein
VQKSIKFHFVSDMLEVVKLALENGTWKKPAQKKKLANIRKTVTKTKQRSA